MGDKKWRGWEDRGNRGNAHKVERKGHKKDQSIWLTPRQYRKA